MGVVHVSNEELLIPRPESHGQPASSVKNHRQTRHKEAVKDPLVAEVGEGQTTKQYGKVTHGNGGIDAHPVPLPHGYRVCYEVDQNGNNGNPNGMVEHYNPAFPLGLYQLHTEGAHDKILEPLLSHGPRKHSPNGGDK